jgi:hypothetical protein
MPVIEEAQGKKSLITAVAHVNPKQKKAVKRIILTAFGSGRKKLLSYQWTRLLLLFAGFYRRFRPDPSPFS